MLDALTQVFETAGFWQALILLALGALATGYFVPKIKASMDKKHFESQKLFEAELARQAEVIAAKSKLLIDLSELLWGYLVAALQVSYMRKADQADAHQASLGRYDDQSWERILKIRTTLGGTRWYAADAPYQRMTEFYSTWCNDLNDRVEAICKDGLADERIEQMHEEIRVQFSQRVDEFIRALAHDFELLP